MPGRFWTPADDALMRAEYGRASNVALAERLGRTIDAVGMRGRKLGLGIKRSTDDGVRNRIAELVRSGHSDREIADALGLTRENVRYHRGRMELPNARDHARQRQARSDNGRRMYASYPSTWKADAQRDADTFAAESGWPAGLRLREVQILNLLARAGRPLTRGELADGIGVPTSRNQARLASVDKKPGYVANLVGLGLVTRLVAMGPRRSNRRRPGRRVDLFCLGPVALSCLIERANHARTQGAETRGNSVLAPVEQGEQHRE